MGLQRPFVDQWNEGPITKIVANYTLQTSYAAGGVAITPGELGMSKILGINVLGVNTAGIGLNHVWNKQTAKLMAIFPTGGAAASPTTLIQPATGVVVAVPAGGVAVTSDAAQPDLAETVTQTPGLGKEVAATADLSSIELALEITCIP